MLSGALQHCAPTERVSARTYLSLTLSDGSQLRYTDDDQMGMVYYLLPEQLSQAARLGEQGPDVLDEPLSLQAFADRLKPYRGEIKGVLTRGGAVSGIGNAYADEVLFAAGIYPFKKRTSLSPAELTALHDAVYRVPAEAVPPPPRAHGRHRSTARSETTSKYTAAATRRARRAAQSSRTSPATATARTTAAPASRGACWGGGDGGLCHCLNVNKRRKPAHICCRPRHVQVVHLLQVHPKLGRHAQDSTNAKRCVRRDPSAAMDDLVYADGWHAHCFGQAILGDTKFLQDLRQVLSGVDWFNVHSCPPQW